MSHSASVSKRPSHVPVLLPALAPTPGSAVQPEDDEAMEADAVAPVDSPDCQVSAASITPLAVESEATKEPVI